MSSFAGPIVAKWVGPELWEIQQPITFYLGNSGTYITVPYGFVCDGATIPRPFWSVLSPWGEYAKAAVIHDYLCRHKRLTLQGIPAPCSRLLADQIFGACMEVLGVPRWKRGVMYRAVRAYAIAKGLK